MINHLRQIAAYKTNLQKSAFLHAKKRGHGNTPIHNHLQRIKYLGIILSKNVNDLYNENVNSRGWGGRLRKKLDNGKISHVHR